MAVRTVEGTTSTRHERFERDGPAGVEDGGREPRRSGGGAWLAAMVAIVAIAAVVGWVIVAWEDDDPAGADIGATASEIVDDPSDWYGRFVAVSGEVDDIGPAFARGIRDIERGGPTRAFSIGAGGERLLIVDINRAGPLPVDEGERVQVTGTVRQFIPQDFDGAFDVDLFGSDGWFEAFEGRPAIVATSIDPTVPRSGGQ